MPRRLLVAVATAIVIVALAAGTAYAHDPIFISESTPPEASPLIEDGTISFATYGRIDRPGGSASVRVRLKAGERLGLDLLVPDREPERSERDFTHLSVKATNPDGTTSSFQAGAAQERFDEPFSKTSYLRLLREGVISTGGVHVVTVTSTRPTRFTLATGVTEQFGSAVSDYERRPLSDLATWYSTPPPPAPAGTTSGTTTGTAMAGSGSAAAPAGTTPAAVTPAPSTPTAPGSESGSAPWPLIAAAGLIAAAIGVTAAMAVRARRARPAVTV